MIQTNNEEHRSVSSYMHAQNGLGLKGFLSGRGCEYITTDKKEGPASGAEQSCDVLCAQLCKVGQGSTAMQQHC